MYEQDNDELFAGARSRNIWIRGLFALLFLAILWFVQQIVLILAAFQFIFAIVTGGPNRRLLPFGRGIAAYMRQMVAFVTWNTETRPFPWSSWPVDGEMSPDDPVMETAAAPSRNWDEPVEPETVYEAPPPAPMADEPAMEEPPVEPAVEEPPVEPEAEDVSPEPPTDVPSDKPAAPPKSSKGGNKAKKKKKSSRQKAASEDADFAGDDVPGDS